MILLISLFAVRVASAQSTILMTPNPHEYVCTEDVAVGTFEFRANVASKVQARSIVASDLMGNGGGYFHNFIPALDGKYTVAGGIDTHFESFKVLSRSHHGLADLIGWRGNGNMMVTNTSNGAALKITTNPTR